MAAAAPQPARPGRERARVEFDFEATHRRVAQRLLRAHHPSLRQLGRTALCLFQMLTTRDFPLSPATTALIVTTLAYFVCPLDLIPDSLLIVGYLDDALLLAEVGVLLSADVARFRARSEGAVRPEPRSTRRPAHRGDPIAAREASLAAAE